MSKEPNKKKKKSNYSLAQRVMIVFMLIASIALYVSSIVFSIIQSKGN